MTLRTVSAALPGTESTEGREQGMNIALNKELNNKR